MKIIVFFVLSFCFIHAKLNIIASIAPQKTFIKHIGGNKVNVLVLVKPNHSVHNYEPSPTDMKMVSKSDAYFSIGVEFEDVWLDKIISSNKKINVLKTDKNVKKISIEGHNNKNTHRKDPHIWLSPDNVKIISKNILDYLIALDIKNKKFYTKNYKKFIDKITQTDKQIKNNLKNINSKYFMVFHPSWGYFSKYYGLSQLAIEVNGRNPTAKEMVSIIKKAKKYKLNVIISFSQKSDKPAIQIAKALDIKVIRVQPLSYEWADNLINLSKALGNKHEK